ncbi:lytic transglycosylase [Salinibacter sp. 10B]|uniref:lytic transglycosylase domain-containing protein n=1 Tax=Salinibacter sp. 10B TaxID=1923971 RepID=UPI000CF3F714|nr:lytic transglycosylase domain-containing protein [Salinibacter sp. 10B]PQJ36001.1 lytic transglycosylase [Salinibacter sp. 10B]
MLPLDKTTVIGAAIVLCVALLSGCGTASSVLPTETETKRIPKDTVVVTTNDTTSLRPEVARLYALEAEILSTEDSTRRAQLLNQAMSELATFLREQPNALEDNAVRDLYSGLTTEYRRYHGYGNDPDSLQMARGQIFSVRAQLFSSLNALDNPLLEESPPVENTEVTGTEIPMTSNRLVNETIRYLQDEPDGHVERWLRRVQVYGPMIDHILAEENVPLELRYLAMAESGLNPNARSWAGAVGMWQFMPSTGRRYGLSINAWVDERRDPEKATRAAARHLRDLYEEFEDWHLAMAAFNCGAGCVRRAIRRADEPDPSYWDAYDYLPRETRGYVPMFIAAAHVMQNPEAYGFEPAPPTPAFSYDYVAVHGSMLSLSTLADLSGTKRSVLESLNPELRRGRIPPSKDRYHLRIPLGSYPRFVWNYAELPAPQKQPATTYRVRSGDTLSEIAQRFGTSTDVLQRLNGLDNTLIRQGQHLVVPVNDYDGALTTEAENDRPMRVQYGTSTPVRPLDPIDTTSETQSTEATTSASASPSTVAARSSSSGSTDEVSSVYRVQQGDTLGGIAERFGISVRQLRAWNDLNGSRIYPGQRLQISE